MTEQEACELAAEVLPPHYLVYLLAPGAIVVSLVFAAAQERVFRVEGFDYGGWMTLISLLTSAATPTAV